MLGRIEESGEGEVEKQRSDDRCQIGEKGPPNFG